MSLESVLGCLNASVMLIDEAGQVTFSNAACERSLGVSPKSFSQTFPGTDWANLLERLRRDEQNLQLETANGATFDATLTITRIDPVVVIVELAPANELTWPGENALLRAQRRLEMAQEAGGSAYFEYVPGWNRFVTSSFGANLVGAPGTTYSFDDILAFLSAEDGQRLSAHFDDVMENGGRFEMEVPITRFDNGEYRWILVRGEMRADAGGNVKNPDRLLGTLQDITDRKRTNLELQSSRALLAEAESLLEGFSFEWDLATRQWSVSDNFYSLMGLEKAEPSRGMLESVIAEEDRDAVLAEVRTGIREDRDFRIEHRVKTIDGSAKHFQLIGRALRDENGNVQRIIGASSNITELKEAQRALRESEAKFRAFIEAFPGTVFIKDSSGRYVFATATEEFLANSNSHPADLIGKTTEEAYGREMALIDEPEEDEVRTTGIPKKSIRRTQYPDGKPRVLVGSLFPIALEQETFIGGYYIDETARVAADEEKERLTSAVEQSGEMIVITDPEGTIVYVNPVFERIMGYRKEEVLGGHNVMWRSGLHDQSMYDEAWRQLQAGEVWQGSLINKRKDGSLIHEETTISQVRDTSGNITGYVEVKRDVTRQRELEQQLAQSQKLESIGTLAGGVAHDYNNVLQTILGNTELIVEQFGQDETLLELATEVKQAAEQSASLTGQLLAFARKQVIMPRAADLNAEFSALQNMLQRLIGTNIRLIHEPAPALWNIRIDPSQIRQVLTNIVVNSRDAIENVGEIHVRMSNVGREQSLELPTGDVQQRDFVRVDILDNGCGMTEDERKRAFEPFFTTKPMNEGTGLGLATVYGIVKQNEGYVFCESQPGVGTRMTLLFPRFEGDLEQDEDENRSDAADMVAAKRILIVEDDPAILKLMVRSLGNCGYDITSASGPDEALEAARGMTFDLVLTDVIMPERNGLDLVSELRQAQPDLRALFMSGYSADILDGVDDEREFIQKPFRQTELMHRIALILGESG